MKPSLKILTFPALAALALFTSIAISAPLSPTPVPHKVGTDQKDFLIDGKPIQIISGEMHYPRVPREYWRDRMQRIKAMGCNTLCTYIFWNMHEPKPGQWDFSGNLDIAEFCRIAQEEGLWVIARPGPYVCAEWEFGGFPSWLLKGRKIKVRSTDPEYMKPTMNYLGKVAEQLAPLQASKGGPIIMVQVENEYGAYGSDKEYLRAHMEAMKKGGLDSVLFYTADQPGCLKGGALPELPAALTFGSGAKNAFDYFSKERPEGGPRMNGEFWCGWFDHWGAVHNPRSTEAYNKEFQWMLENGISVNFYMIHGGTSFGFMPGANGGKNKITPDITSYDYSAPISESGRLTERYYKFRESIEKHLGTPLPKPPADPVFITLPALSFNSSAGMFDNLPKPVTSQKPMIMEDLGQAYGFILYRTKVKGPMENARLSMESLHDRAIVLVDGKRMGTADRRHGQTSVTISLPEGEHTLDILVENLGRINYGGAITTEYKGITESVTLNGKELLGFENYSLPCLDRQVTKLPFTTRAPSGDQPVFHRTTFTVEKPGDTYLDMRDGWNKGVVWVNGHNLGRYWFVGPQQALYCPAPFLKKGENEIIVLDLQGGKGTVSGIADQIWKTNKEKDIFKLNRKPGQTIVPKEENLVHSAQFTEGETVQNIRFEKPAKGRYFAIESISAFNGENHAAIAELDILDEKGQPLKKEEWKIVYADSEEVESEQANADMVMDRQPVTFWHTAWSGGNSTPHPHVLILDLGGNKTISGFQYLPRPGAAAGKIKDYKVYVRETPFLESK